MQDCLAGCLFCLSNTSFLEYFYVLSEAPQYSIYTTEQRCHHNTCNDQVTTCPIPSSILIIPFQPTPSIIWIAKQFRYQYRCSFCFNQLAPYRQGLCYSKRIITIQGFSTQDEDIGVAAIHLKFDFSTSLCRLWSNQFGYLNYPQNE